MAFIGLMLRRMDRMEDRLQDQMNKQLSEVKTSINGLERRMDRLESEIKNVSEKTSRIEGMLVGPDLLREHISAERKAKGKADQPKQ